MKLKDFDSIEYQAGEKLGKFILLLIKLFTLLFKFDILFIHFDLVMTKIHFH